MPQQDRSNGFDVGRRATVVGFAGAALISALSLLALDQATSVDANNWLIWARQAAIGNPIDIRHGFTVFKALPVIYALPFARVSPQLADLAWLWLVRFAALSCSVLLFKVAARNFGRLAGVIAALLPFALSTWVSFAIDGDSEPVCALLLLASAWAVQARRLTSASVLLAFAGLMRPEVVGVLAAMFVWRALHADARRAAGDLALASAIIASGWVLAPLAFGTNFGDSARGAQSKIFVPNAKDGVFTLLPNTVWLLVAIGLWGAWRKRDAVLASVAAACAIWVAEVEVMGSLGWSGLDRYMFPPVIVMLAIAGAGAATLVELVPNRAARRVAAGAVIAASCLLVAIGMPLNADNLRARQATADSATSVIAAFNRIGGLKHWGNCRPFVGNTGRSLILARLLGEPFSSFTPITFAPTLAFIPIRQKSNANGPMALNPKSAKLVAVAKPDWALVYYAGARGCKR